MASCKRIWGCRRHERIFGIRPSCSARSCWAFNGAFYAMLSLGLAVIFGMLNVMNFTHGALYMMGAFAAWLLLGLLDVPFWASLVLAPLIVGLFGVVHRAAAAEAPLPARPSLRLPADLRPGADHRGPVPVELGLVGRALSRRRSRASPTWASCHAELPRCVVVAALVICLATWYVIERTRLGAYLRAATENPPWCAPSASTCRA